MPIYLFVCRRCKETFEQRAPLGTKIACSPCCTSLADKRFVPTTQIRVTEGFLQVNRSDVCMVKGVDWQKRTWPAHKVGTDE